MRGSAGFQFQVALREDGIAVGGETHRNWTGRGHIALGILPKVWRLPLRISVLPKVWRLPLRISVLPKVWRLPLRISLLRIRGEIIEIR